MDSPQTNFDYKPDDAGPAHTQAATGFAWQAPEFIEHPHGSGWYLMLAIGTIIIAGLVYLTSKDAFATVTVAVVGVIVGIFAKHKPTIVDYELGSRSLRINGKDYPYSGYKSFTILQEGALSSINLHPLKRLMPPITAYFNPDDEEKVLAAVGDHLPYEQRPMDAVDRLSRRLRL
jgi:hypothetical protein